MELFFLTPAASGSVHVRASVRHCRRRLRVWSAIDTAMAFDFYSVNCLVNSPCSDDSSLAMTVACFFVFNVWEVTVKETVLGTGASRDNQAFPCLIMTINDACTFNLALIITISDASKNQRKRLDPNNQIKVYRLIGTLVKDSYLSALQNDNARYYICSRISALLYM